MTGAVLYGKLKSEKLAEESRIAHQVVSEIGNFGVNDRQRYLIMYYLALELEDIEMMRSITSFLKEKKGTEMFISKEEE